MGGALTQQISDDERRLAQGAVAGDSQAFAEIVDRFKGSVLGICRRYVGGLDAQDLAQETFVRAFVNRERFDPSRPLKPWLLTIARNLCIDRLRSSERRQHPEPDMSVYPDRSVNAEQELASREQLTLLRRGLLELPDGQREVIAMYHQDGLSYREMSEVLDVPIGTVMTWLHRGRRRLREIVLALDEIGDGGARASSGGD
jgi:RNA polymerase sigma-70 factor (ECF subfamily)